MVYFITIRTYGTWLPGCDRGYVDRENNECHLPFLPANALLELENFDRLRYPPIQLNHTARLAVAEKLIEVALHRGWTIHAAQVRPTHVHVIVSGEGNPEPMMNAMQSWTTRRLRERGFIGQKVQPWARHVSTSHLQSETIILEKIKYVLFYQGDPMERILENQLIPREFDEEQWLKSLG